MNPILAELTNFEISLGICTIVFGVVGMVIGVVSLLKKTDTVISPQPLAIKIVEEMHEMFASKKEFNELLKNNTERHGQLFNRITAVENSSRAELKHEMEKVDSNMTFIRESLVELKTKLEERTT